MLVFGKLCLYIFCTSKELIGLLLWFGLNMHAPQFDLIY